MAADQTVGALFEQSVAIMARLRAPGGCPWDREQTPETIRKYTLEETYEVLDAIERQDWPHLSEELGDLLLQVLFYAQMAGEAEHFSLGEVLEGLNRKLVRRHPHVFGERASAGAGNAALSLAAVPGDGAAGAAAVVANWNSIKEMEKQAQSRDQSAGYLAGVLRAQGSLAEAAKLGSAAARAGFDWSDPGDVLAKVHEELAEVEAEIAASASEHEKTARLAEEVGDLLFTVAHLARHLKVDAELALRDANAKFRRRFEATMEQGSVVGLEEMSAEDLDHAWRAAKAREGVDPLSLDLEVQEPAR